MSFERRESTATVHFTKALNEVSRVVVACVIAICDDGGDKSEQIWGHGENSVSRALAELTSSCGCGASWHEQADELRDEPDQSEGNPIDGTKGWELKPEEIGRIELLAVDETSPRKAVAPKPSSPPGLAQAVAIVRMFEEDLRTSTRMSLVWFGFSEEERKVRRRNWAKKVLKILGGKA